MAAWREEIINHTCSLTETEAKNGEKECIEYLKKKKKKKENEETISDVEPLRLIVIEAHGH